MYYVPCGLDTKQVLCSEHVWIAHYPMYLTVMVMMHHVEIQVQIKIVVI